jgi:hypothetical protein
MTHKERISVVFNLLKTLFQTPKSVFLILTDENRFKKQLLKKYGKTEFQEVDINFFLSENKTTIKNYTFLDGGSMVTDLALLKSIAEQFSNCQYLEIGTWRGESIVNVADVKGSHCTSINLSPEQIIALGLPEKYANEHGILIQNRKNIDTIFADSQKFDFSTLNKTFDLIFVDGDHTYEAVKSDTKNVFKLLKDENSVIVWHDYGFDSVNPRYSVIKGILDGLSSEEHANLYHVSNTMCAVFTRSKALLNHIDNDKNRLNKVFEVSIESKIFSQKTD